jgi:hypothetical protein
MSKEELKKRAVEFERSLIESRVDIIVKRLVPQVEDDLDHYISEELLGIMDITSDPKMHDLWNDMYLEIHDRLIIELNHRR